MPYDNLPESDWSKMDQCVEDVMSKDSSLDKESAIAICYTSIAGKSDKQHGGEHAGHGGAHGEGGGNGKSQATTSRNIGSNSDGSSRTNEETESVRLVMAGAPVDRETINVVEAMDNAGKLRNDEHDALDDAPVYEKQYRGKRVIRKLIDAILDPFTAKAGARHNASDSKALQSIHDSAVDLGASCPMSVFKQADGKYRWVTFSSNAYEDRDGEIVSTKAQSNDVAELDKTNDYGVLRWWHVGKPYATKAGDWRTWVAGKGVDLGVCDFSAMHGRVRIESGAFDNNEIGARFKEVADKLSVSIGFSHPEDEPNRGGVFENIHTFERSLLPRGKQSNYFADIQVIQKESNMEDKKLDKFKELMGGLADLILNKAEQTDKAAEAAGVAFKEGENGKHKMPDGQMMNDTEMKAYIRKCMDEMMAEDKARKPDEAKAAKEAKFETALAELQTTLKQLQGNDEQIATALNQLGAISKKNAEAIAQLNGELPKSLQSLKRSNADDNVVPEEKVNQTLKNLANPAGQVDFFSWAATGSNKTAAPVA